MFGFFDKKLMKEIAFYSFWIFLSSIIDRVYWSSGQFILGMFVSTTSVAIYALAIQFQSIYMGLSSALTSVLLPKITTLVVSKSNDKDVSSLFIKVGRLQFLILGLVLFGFILFGKPFIIYWAGSDYESSYFITLLFLIPLTIPLIQNLGFTILQARNQMKFRSLTYLFISIISLICAIPLSKRFGGIGCACSVAGALLIGQFIIMNIYYKIKISLDIKNFWCQIIRMAIAPITLTIIYFLFLKLHPINSILFLSINILCFSILFILIVWCFSLNKEEKKLIQDVIKIESRK